MMHGFHVGLIVLGVTVTAFAQNNAPSSTPAVTNAPAIVATNGTPATSTNAASATPASTNVEAKIESRYQLLLQQDDAALEEIQKLIKKSNAQQGADLKEHSEDELRLMIQSKVDAVKKGYQSFLKENPHHVKAMIAYGSFLCDIQEEEEGVKWWLKAQDLDPKNAAVRNNLANHYSHDGDPKRAIEEYEAAIQIQPSEPTYYFNMGNVMYLFRKETAESKNWTEDEVFEHSLDSLRRARDLEPANYDYAYAYAETFYGVKTPNWQRALDAWDYCLKLNITPLQRDQIYTHLARINIRLGKIKKARDYLDQVKSEQWQDLRQRLNEIATHQESLLKIEDTLKPDTSKSQ